MSNFAQLAETKLTGALSFKVPPVFTDSNTSDVLPDDAVWRVSSQPVFVPSAHRIRALRPGSNDPGRNQNEMLKGFPVGGNSVRSSFGMLIWASPRSMP